MLNEEIPFLKLEDGYKKGRNLIIRLYEDSKFFYDSGRFTTATSLAILAREEITKISSIRLYQNNRKNMPMEEWKTLSSPRSHELKSCKSYEDGKDIVSSLGPKIYEKIVETEKNAGCSLNYGSYQEAFDNPLVKSRLQKFNTVKKYCWYLDWINSEWVTMSTLYEEWVLRQLAIYFIQNVNYEIHNEVLNKRYPLAFYWEIPLPASLLRKDPVYRECQRYFELIKSPEYEDIIALSCMLIDHLPNRITNYTPLKFEKQVKQNWLLSDMDMYDGAILSLKNASGLITDAKSAFVGNRYSISILLIILALEEFGKHFMFYELIEEGKKITKDIWNKEFRNHQSKLDAITRYLKKHPPIDDSRKDFDVQIQNLENLIQKWRHSKLETLYLHWDTDKNEWYCFDDLSIDEIKGESEYAIDLITRFFTIYVEETRNTSFYTIKELAELFKNNKLHFECRTCDSRLESEIELATHKSKYPFHNVDYMNKS